MHRRAAESLTGLVEPRAAAGEDLAPYIQVHDEVDAMLAAWEARLPVLLKGRTGCGKTHLVQTIADRLGLPLTTVACHEDMVGADLVGRYLFEGGETTWHDGPLTRAVREGGVCYLDEIVEARADATVAIHSVADHRRELYVDRLDERVAVPGTFMLVVSYNPGYQSALKDLKPSTRQRFIAIELDFPPPEVEVEIIRAHAQVEPSVADALVRLGTAIRRLDEPALAETASPRTLIAAARLGASGVALQRAARLAIAAVLTDEPELGRSLGELCDTYLAG